MKKNTKTYILLTLVFLIWGIVGIRMLKAFKPEVKVATSPVIETTFNPLPFKAKDTFSIVGDYRDPFLGTWPTTKTKKKYKTKVPETPQITIRYTGIITANDAKDTVFFLTVDGQSYMLSAGEKNDVLKLIRGNKNKITVQIGTQIKNIPISL